MRWKWITGIVFLLVIAALYLSGGVYVTFRLGEPPPPPLSADAANKNLMQAPYLTAEEFLPPMMPAPTAEPTADLTEPRAVATVRVLEDGSIVPID